MNTKLMTVSGVCCLSLLRVYACVSCPISVLFCLHVCAYAFKSRVHCGSVFEPDASGLSYYCTSICVRSCCNWRASCVDSRPGFCFACGAPLHMTASDIGRPWFPPFSEIRHNLESYLMQFVLIFCLWCDWPSCFAFLFSGKFFPQFLSLDTCWSHFVEICSNFRHLL